MKTIEPHILDAIEKISAVELKKVLVKVIKKDKFWYDYMLVNYVDRNLGESELYEKALSDIKGLMFKGYKGYAYELRMAKMLAACNKRITDFDKNCKNKERVIDLILFVLERPFSEGERSFGTCFTAFNHKVYILLKKAITLYEKKIHEDIRINYTEQLNKHLVFMHQHSNHLDYVYDMPKNV
jgi:hypothetical protein